jgi:hypothetical protein
MRRDLNDYLKSYLNSINTGKEWVRKNTSISSPAPTALSASIVTTTVLLFVLNVLEMLSGTVSVWIHIFPYAAGVFAGYTGWKYGQL